MLYRLKLTFRIEWSPWNYRPKMSSWTNGVYMHFVPIHEIWFISDISRIFTIWNRFSSKIWIPYWIYVWFDTWCNGQKVNIHQMGAIFRYEIFFNYFFGVDSIYDRSIFLARTNVSDCESLIVFLNMNTLSVKDWFGQSINNNISSNVGGERLEVLSVSYPHLFTRSLP